MTAQIYKADGQLAEDDDQMVLESNLMQPDADLVVLDSDLAAPDADLVVLDSDLAAPDADLVVLGDLVVPEDDQTVHEEPTSDPAGAMVVGDLEPVAPIVSQYEGSTTVGDGAEESGMAGNDAGSPSQVSAAGAEAESVSESPLAGDSASAGGRWHEIQALFVDDPHASVELAASLVDDRVEALVVFVKERQHSLQSAWQDHDAGTEDLRIALQHYRTFWKRLEDCRLV
jgi:hypothetical protein